MRAFRLPVQPLRVTASLAERGVLSPRYAPAELVGKRGGPWRLTERRIELEMGGAEKPPPPPPLPSWRLEDSIWGARRHRADSKDYFDTDATLVAMGKAK